MKVAEAVEHMTVAYPRMTCFAPEAFNTTGELPRGELQQRLRPFL